MEYSNSYDEIKDRRVNNLVLNSSYQSYTSNHIQKQLQNLDQLNRRSQSRTGGLFGSTDQINFDQNSLLVVALSTIIMLAKKETVSEKNYMYTKLLLESILDENGLQLSNVPALLAHMKYMYIKNQVIADDCTDQTEVVDIKPSKTNEELVDPEELEKSLLETTDEFLHHEPLTNSTPKSHRVRLLSPRDEVIQFYESGVNEVADNSSRLDGNESRDNQLAANVHEPSDNAPELAIDVPESFDKDAEPSIE
ncbi:unnamed protein product [Diamesa hyperborea]